MSIKRRNSRPRQKILPEVKTYLTAFERCLRAPDQESLDPLIDLKNGCLEEMIEAARDRNDREKVGPEYLGRHRMPR